MCEGRGWLRTRGELTASFSVGSLTATLCIVTAVDADTFASYSWSVELLCRPGGGTSQLFIAAVCLGFFLSITAVCLECLFVGSGSPLFVGKPPS